MPINLKLLRFQLGLTLEEVSQRAGLTRSYLSKVERGLSTPSIESALAIANALGVSVDRLFGRSGETEEVSIFRADPANLPEVLDNMVLVAGQSPGRVMRAFVIRPSSHVNRGRLMSHHQGEEILYVLEGSVELHIARRKEKLSKGDCIHFDSTTPHRLLAADSNPSSVLVVIASTEGDPNEALG